MSLDVTLTIQQYRPTEVFWRNITHNLTSMALAANLYHALWRPDEIGITNAHDLIKPLTEGLEMLLGDAEGFKQHEPSNGWGSYEGLVSFVQNYLEACKEYPDADIEVSR